LTSDAWAAAAATTATTAATSSNLIIFSSVPEQVADQLDDRLRRAVDDRRHGLREPDPLVDGRRFAPDDEHPTEDFAWLCARRAVEMSNQMSAAVLDARRLFVEIAAISVAAIEAIDRKDAREVPLADQASL